MNTVKQMIFGSRYFRLAMYSICIIVILELTVFNYKCYSNLFNKPVDAEPKPYGAIVNTGSNYYRLNNGEKGFEITDLDTHIKNIYIDMSIVGDKTLINNKYININIQATDAGNAKYFQLPERTVVYDQRQTKYIPLNLNGKSSSLRINIKGCDDNIILLKKLVINSKIPFEFNFVRVILLFIIVSVIYIIRPKSGFYKYIFNINSKKQSLVLSAVVLINLVVIFALGIAHPNNGISTNSHHNQYHWLAEAIMDGHFYLNDEPPKSLIDMENPYDRHLRDEIVKGNGDSYKWDTAYYNGKYYVYFGIVPELLFFLPTRLLGIMIINKGPVIIMTMLAVIFGYLLIRELTERWFKNTSFLLYLILSVIFVNSTGIYLAIKVPDLYMIPISHAYAFSLMGIYLWLKALPYGEYDKLKGAYLFLGSLCMALVAGCRPQVVFASFIAIPLFWDYVFKKRELFSVNSIFKTFGFIIPYVVVAAFLMYYNYERFGNVFDFGASYNLTVMDMVSEKFNISKIPLAIYTCFIQPPYLIAAFPFLTKADIVRDFMGNYVTEEYFGGLFPCHIILFTLFFITKVRYNIKEKKLWIPLIIMIVLSFAICIIDCNTGGLVLRYLIDFMWLIFLAAVIVSLALYEKYKDTAYGNIFKKFISISLVWSMCYNFMLLFNEGTATYKNNIPQLYSFFKHTIEFWI